MRRRGAVVVGAVVVALVAAAVWFAFDRDDVPFLSSEQCTAQVGGRLVELDLEQARYAGLISAIAVERGLPARAASIALAAAYQESDLHNLHGGDRDSAGLFQQRPSQGWGSLDQVRDPVHATDAFYDALTKVEGYETLAITVAAQEVQRSGYPDAYADHEADARALASALTGNSAAAFGCRLDHAARGSASAVRRDLAGRFPAETVAPADGHTVEVALGPATPESTTRGWAIAAYLVSQSDRLDISEVAVGGRSWTAGSGPGWHGHGATAGELSVRVTVR